MAELLTMVKQLGEMTYSDGIAFVERTRRQLDRFEFLPRHTWQEFNPDSAIRMRAIIDDLEKDIEQHMSQP